MPERDGYINGVPCWIDTTQPDPSHAAEFYSGLFGWECEDVMPPDAPGRYFMARIRGGDVAAISSQMGDTPQPAMWNTYVWVDSADDTAAKVQEAGGQIVVGPFDVMDSGRMAMFSDPEGAMIAAWQPNQHRGARIVNENGSLNFNGLNTRDTDGAKRFYGAVFGWETLDVGGADMWVLPGYGDHLEQGSPGLREGMAQMGAPKGFEDVVAQINPIPADQPDLPAHWSVTFAVDDADATAEKAAQLGGQVVIPPFDAPWVRMTLIADPQGAGFFASKFVAENKDLPA